MREQENTDTQREAEKAVLGDDTDKPKQKSSRRRIAVFFFSVCVSSGAADLGRST